MTGYITTRLSNALTTSLLLCLLLLFCSQINTHAADEVRLNFAQRLNDANRFYTEHNYLDAFTEYKQLLLSGSGFEPIALQQAIISLQRLGLESRADSFLSEVITAHAQDWRCLLCVGEIYSKTLTHYGYIEDNKFYRGHPRYHTTTLNVTTHDHLHALTYMQRAKKLLTPSNATTDERADLYYTLAQTYIQGIYPETAIRLLLKSNYASIPPYTEPIPYADLRGTGAPTTTQGEPYFFQLPDDEENASNDGELFRYYLAQSADSSKKQARARKTLAEFSQMLYGVETLTNNYYNNPEDRPFITELATLKNSESIARLESGIQRFDLPSDYNYLEIFNTLLQNNEDPELLIKLAVEYENRRHFETAASCWRRLLKLPTASTYQINTATKHLEQLENSFIEFENTRVQYSGVAPSLWLRFRNATQVTISLQELDTDRLIAKTIALLKNPDPANINRASQLLPDIGQELINRKQHEFLGNTIYSTEIDLSKSAPSIAHGTGRSEITLPNNLKGGAYYVLATLPSGYQVGTILWLSDLTLTTKPLLSGGRLYITSNSNNGSAVKDTKISIFAYNINRQNNRNLNTPPYLSTTLYTNTNGLSQLPANLIRDNYNYLAHATAPDGRQSYIGFEHLFNQHLFHQPKVERLLFITDKPLYSAGEEIKISGWIRDYNYRDNITPNQTNPKTFNITILTPKGEKIQQQQVTVAADGSFYFTFQTQPNSDLGLWQLHTDLDITQAGNFFRVEEFVKPEFTVDISPLNSEYTTPETVAFKINARYNFGKPLSNAAVEYEIIREVACQPFIPRGRWDWLYGKGYQNATTSYPATSKHRIIPPFFTSSELVAQATVYTDNNGEATVTLQHTPPANTPAKTAYTYRIQAKVSDSANRIVQASTSNTYQPTTFDLSSSTDQNYYDADELIKLTVLPYRGDQPLKTNLPSALTINIYKVDPAQNKHLVNTFSVLKQNSDYSYTQSFKLSDAGYYIVESLTKDHAGNPISTTQDLYIYSADAANSLPLPQDRRLLLISKKKTYAVGDTAEILLLNADRQAALPIYFNPTATGYPLPEVIRPINTATILHFTLKATDTPNTFVEVQSTAGLQLTTASVELLTPPVTKIINLRLTPEKPEYSPASQANITLHATDTTGKPVTGSAVVTIYDAALEQIVKDQAYPDISKFFWGFNNYYSPQASTSLEKYSYNLLATGATHMQPIGLFGNFFNPPEIFTPRASRPALNRNLDGAPTFKMSMVVQEATADSATGIVNQDSENTSELRQDFSTGAVFIHQVKFDKNGNTTLSVPLPDSLTTWKIRSWIMTTATEVGQAESAVLTSKELMLIPAIPRYLISGDRANIVATVYNNSVDTVEATVKLATSTNLISDATPTHTLQISSDSSQSLTFSLSATTPAPAQVTLSAATNDSSDALTLPLSVYTREQQLFSSKTALLPADMPAYTADIVLPARSKPDSANLQLQLYPNLSSLLLQTAQTLPKSTISTNDTLIANLLPEMLLQEAGISTTTTTKESIIDRLAPKIIQLQKLQNADGGWSWIGNKQTSSPYITALILDSLERVDKMNYPLPASLITGARLYLLNYQDKTLKLLRNAESGKNPGKSKIDNLDALVYRVLSLSANENRAMREYLLRDRGELSVYGLTSLASGLYNNQQSEPLATVLKNIKQYLIRDQENDTAYLSAGNQNYRYYWYGTVTQSTAEYLNLCNLTGSEANLCNLLAHYLINNIKNISRQDSIHKLNTVFASLSKYQKNHTTTATEVKLKATLNDQPLTLNPDKQNPQTLTASVPQHILHPGNNKLSIARTGTPGSPLYLTHTLSYSSLEKIAQPHGLELKAERHYYRLIPQRITYTIPDGLGGQTESLAYYYQRQELQPGAEISKGELLEVELLVKSKNDYEYIQLIDNKPACLEPVANKSAFGYNGISYYTEYRDSSVNYYIESMPQGNHSFCYRAYALFSGKFTAPAALSHGVYASELNSNSAGFKFIVKE